MALIEIGAAANDRTGDALRSAFDKVNKHFQHVFNVLDYGAIGDDVNDDTEAIQEAIDAAEAAGGGTVYFPHPPVNYIVMTPLVVNNLFVVLQGDDKGTVIYNGGTGATLRITAGGDYCNIRNLSLWGIGGSYGVGAINTYGIELVGVNYIMLDNVSIRYNGSHGLYNHGGGNSIELHKCDIRHNVGDGINSITALGSEQNGNALMIFGGGINLNGGNGIKWSAAGLSLLGVRFEANVGAGVCIDSTGAEITSKNASIYGSYFEQNRGGQIVIRAGAGFYGGNFTGNYLRYGSDGLSSEAALIVGSGAGTIQLLGIAQNAYSATDAAITHWVNLGSRPTGSCTIDTMDNAAQFTGLGSAKTFSYFQSTDINTSAKLAAILTDETGTGSVVFSTNPQFATSIGIGVAASGSANLPINTSGSANATIGPRFENSNAGTSAAASVTARVGSLDVQLAILPSNYALANIANRGIVTPTSSCAGLTEFLATGQNWDVQINNGTVARVSASGLLVDHAGTGATQSPRAALEIVSTTKGMLHARMTKAQRDAITAPPDGLTVYQTDNTPGLRVRENGAWVRYTATADP